MAKRKRDPTLYDEEAVERLPRKAAKPTTALDGSALHGEGNASSVTIQVVTGSYERVLHGFTATLSGDIGRDEAALVGSPPVQLTDTFLFHAHASAVRCLALSPPSPEKLILASGGTDERINLYALSPYPPETNDKMPSVPMFSGSEVLENPKNRELGFLLHHPSSISALSFPSRSKLLAAAEDNTISVTKTRDWTVVSTVKAPRPKAQGRPGGDTAPPGGSPSGINDFAVHPSMKLMLSVGKGEKCLRLWNLVTGKKAGVLSFSKEILQSAKEGTRGSGEGRRIVWNAKGEDFAVAFEWGAVVFGMDCAPKCRLLPTPMSKLHRIRYITVSESQDFVNELLAVSTEDGRVIFYSTQGMTQPGSGTLESAIPDAQIRAQLGGRPCGLSGRIKDFTILHLGEISPWRDSLCVVTGSSDGAVRLWRVWREELQARQPESTLSHCDQVTTTPHPRSVGTLLKAYETGNRITCLIAFVMQQPRNRPTPEFESTSDDSADGSNLGVVSDEDEDE